MRWPHTVKRCCHLNQYQVSVASSGKRCFAKVKLSSCQSADTDRIKNAFKDSESRIKPGIALVSGPESNRRDKHPSLIGRPEGGDPVHFHETLHSLGCRQKASE